MLWYRWGRHYQSVHAELLSCRCAPLHHAVISLHRSSHQRSDRGTFLSRRHVLEKTAAVAESPLVGRPLVRTVHWLTWTSV
eukprot:13738356-Ditylum_brightwellii.AAC.1